MSRERARPLRRCPKCGHEYVKEPDSGAVKQKRYRERQKAKGKRGKR